MRFGAVRLISVGGPGPEDVVVDAEGNVYTGLEDGRVLRVDPDGERVDVIADTGGRPLGLELYGDDELLVCDADNGLLVVTIASGQIRTLVKDAAGKPVLVCNNAAIARDGTVYFSDSSSRFVLRRWREDLIEQTGSGRLLRRNVDGSVDELLTGLQFANGVALAADESFVAVAESGECRVRRVWLDGDRTGESDVLLDDLPGFPDNISTGSDGLIWVTQASPKVASLDVVRRLPAFLRAVVRRLPTSLQPSPGRTVGVLGVDGTGQVVHELSGEIDEFQMLTGVRERAGVLYFGSLQGTAIATTEVAPS